MNVNSTVLCAEGFFRNSKKSLLNITLVVFTVCLEEIFSTIAFRCPCTGHFTYGMLFLWAPALLLFLSGILVNNDTWYYCRALRNSRAQSKSAQPAPATMQWTRIEKLLDVLAHASVPPAVWLILSLLQKKFLVCALFGPALHVPPSQAKETVGNVVDADVFVPNITDNCRPVRPRARADELSYIAESQVLGWCVMIMLLVVIVLYMCVMRCEFAREMSLPDAERCKELEAREAVKRFKEVARELATAEGTRRVDEWFDNYKPKQAEESRYKMIDDVAQKLRYAYGSSYIDAMEREKLENNAEQKTWTMDEPDGGGVDQTPEGPGTTSAGETGADADKEVRDRGNTFLTSLPLVSVRRHCNVIRCNSV